MTKFEDQIRVSLRRDAVLPASSLPERIPRSVIRGIRVRRVTTIAAGLLVAVGVVATLSPLTRLAVPTPVGPGDDPGPVHRVVLGLGSTGGYPWRLELTRDEVEWCLELHANSDRTHRCWSLVAPVPDLDTSLEFATFPFRHGPVSEEAEHVVFIPENGKREDGRIFVPPSSFDLDFNVFVLMLAEPAHGRVLALGSSGDVIAKQSIPRPSDVMYSTGDDLTYAVITDVHDNIIALSETLDEACVFETRPGGPSEGDDIRCLIQADIDRIAPEVKEWWLSRPDDNSSTEGLIAWWRAYPLEEPHPQLQNGRLADQHLEPVG